METVSTAGTGLSPSGREPWVTLLALTVSVFAATIAAPAIGADTPDLRSCEAAAEDYDSEADQYGAAAARYRAWASAERTFGSSPYGTEWSFKQQAKRLDFAAERSRARAAEYRRQATSPGVSSEACGAAERVPANG